MIALLAFRSLLHRPWRSLLLFLGYGMGVAVMIVLLSIGEALLDQARSERLVGGGNVTVLPEGLDIEVMKTGGVGGLFFSIDHSRFIYRQILASPRLSPFVRAVAPQIDGKLLYLYPQRRTGVAVRAFGEIPDATRAVGAAPSLIAGSWTDDDGDRRYINPSPLELHNEIDHFHMPPRGVANLDSWAEWHYFNVIAPDGKSWVFISYIVGGNVLSAGWGGRLVVTVHAANGGIRRYAASVPGPLVHFSTTTADLQIGAAAVTVLPGGSYRIMGSATREGASGPPLKLDVVVTPAPRAYFPGASLGERDFVSGYVVPGLRADATGAICEGAACTQYVAAQSYHDHNWGVWRGVTWDWGASRAGSYTVLYGRVIPPDSIGNASGAADERAAQGAAGAAHHGADTSRTPLFVYLVDSLGFRAVFRPRNISYTDGQTIIVNNKTVLVPSRAEFADARGGDTLRVRLDIESAMGTDTRSPVSERGESTRSRTNLHPYFIQMKGRATISGRIDGAPVSGTGHGFFETYR